MYRRPQPVATPSRQTMWWLVVIGATILVASIIAASLSILIVFSAVRGQNFSQAQVASRIALPFIRAANTITLHRSADLQLVEGGLRVLSHGNDVSIVARSWLEGTTDGSLQPATIAQARQLSAEVAQGAEQMAFAWPRAFFPRKILSPTQHQQFTALLSGLHVTAPLVNDFLTGQQRVLILLQNSEELRAAGGFSGSYVVLQLQDGVVERLQVYDIYDADGQYKGYRPAPKGHEAYLSDGHGLRLPDANWAADFPSAAQSINGFFAETTEPNLDAIFAVNLPVMKDLFAVLGPVPLTDYQVTVTAENIGDVARANRQEFFPGSQQKKHFLQALLTQLKLRLTQLSGEQRHAIAESIRRNVLANNLLAWSPDQRWQHLFRTWHLSGDVPTSVFTAATAKTPSWYLMSVESNVGINKANRLLDRTAVLQLYPSTQRAVFQLSLQNNNPLTNPVDPDEKLHYANYQRFLVPPNTTVQTISIDGKALASWDDEIVFSSGGVPLRQVGFLVPVKVGARVNVSLVFADTVFGQEPRIIIQKQPGVPPYPFSLEIGEKTITELLGQDITAWNAKNPSPSKSDK